MIILNLHTARELLKTKSVYDLPLRVTFYARVSSEKDEQLNSLENQISYYTDLIRKNAAWEYVPGYIDEGLSGITTKKRERFHQMIDDARDGRFDLVITKEISRFARNTVDSIAFTRELLSNGVGVFFQNDNINTFDEDSELRLTIMAGIAQDEMRKLSSRVKFGHQEAIRKSVVLGNSRIWGYSKKDKRLVVDETEAAMVRELYTLYATDEYSLGEIEEIFWNKGYRNRNGNRIAHSTMSGTIANPKYKGYYVGNKVRVVDMFTKKQQFLPPEEWVMFKDETGEIVPAIVDEDLWDKANEVLTRRSRSVKQRQNTCNNPNLLTGKLFCTHCGLPYYRRDSKDRRDPHNSRWICSGRIKNGADSCPSVTIRENEIKPILLDVFDKSSGATEDLLTAYIEAFRSMAGDKTVEKRIASLQSKIDLEKKKKEKLLDFNAAGKLDDRDFLEMNEKARKTIEDMTAQIAELRESQVTKDDLKARVETIRAALEEARKDAAGGVITKGFVDKYIDRIFVTPEQDRIVLDIKLVTGSAERRFLEKLGGHHGHIMKKMIMNAENAMKTNG